MEGEPLGLSASWPPRARAQAGDALRAPLAADQLGGADFQSQGCGGHRCRRGGGLAFGQRASSSRMVLTPVFADARYQDLGGVERIKLGIRGEIGGYTSHGSWGSCAPNA